MDFAPIAIVGQGCVLPQASSPEQLWRLVLDGRDALTLPPPDYWNHATLAALTHPEDPPLAHLLSNRGGFVDGFAAHFDASGYRLSAESILALDPLFQWLLYAGREALRNTGHDTRTTSPRIGAIVGNLSYPTRSLVEFAERVWWTRGPTEAPDVDPRNRFSSGLPAQILAEALGLGAGAFALDSACASSLYAIKLACDWLHDGRADLMLAGGVNAADGFIIHGGFSVLQAISPTGRSRPFHRQADGLVPAEGAALVALKRLEDAEAAGDQIAGVIRGVGLSNDGRGHGFLVPSAEAQSRAMRCAYAMAGLRPADVSLVECHATGTLVGDATEIRSMTRVFQDVDDLPIGSLKSNLGHLITAAGAAGLLKILAAMDAGIRPPTLHADAPIEALAGSPFRLLDRAEPWTSATPLRAGLSAFGFGGNNAHLVVEQWSGVSRRYVAVPAPPDEPVAITAIGIRVGEIRGREAFTRVLLAGESILTPRTGATPAARAETIELDLFTLRFPPTDLKDALPQQLLMLETAQQIAHEIGALPSDRTGVFVGMQCDAEGARIAARCRLPHRLAHWRGVNPADDDARRKEAYAGISQPLTPASVIGAMANIVANRVQSCFDLKGPGIAISAEELSGIRALEIGARAVRRGEVDAAVVGAVDLSCEPVHEAAAAAMLPEPLRSPADAAVLLVLKRLSDARRDGDTIYATLPRPSADIDIHAAAFDSDAGATRLSPIIGHAHAASGLLHATAAALACYHRALPGHDRPAAPWLPAGDGSRMASVSVTAHGGPTVEVALQAQQGGRPASPIAVPGLRVYSADSRDGLLRALQQDEAHAGGRLRLAIVSRDAASLHEQRERAIAALRSHRLEPDRLRELGDGIYLGEEAPDGDVAFVFTGPAGAYPYMGRDLLLALPELADGAAARCGPIRRSPESMAARAAATSNTPLDTLWNASVLSQVHAELTRGVLALEPQAAIGFSAGESTALFALGAWTDMDRMHQEFEARGVFSRELGGSCDVVRRAWPDADQITWASWRVFAPVEDVHRVLSSEPRVHLTIVSAPGDVVIAGDADGCRRIVAALGATRAQALDYNLVMHCPEAAVYADEWRALHHRPTTTPAGIRFYTHATCSHYQPTADRVAEMLTGQAMRTLDFPRLIENAWNDGVRVFLEHGPQAGCTRWIDQILDGRPHVAVALDRYGTSSLQQAVDTVARLAAAGVTVTHETLVERLAQTERPRPLRTTSSLTRFAAHWPPVRVPIAPAIAERPMQPRAEIDPMPQFMEPAPWLPPVSDDWTIEHGESGDRDTRETIGQLAAIPADRPRQPSHPIAAHHARVSAVHGEFVRQQTDVQQRFLRLMQDAEERLARFGHGGPTSGTVVLERDAASSPAAEHAATSPARTRYSTDPPRGPRLSREQLKVHASGAISTVFGPSFAGQDRFRVQVRLPEEPLLLVDRVTGIDAEPGSMKLGTVWTETDVEWDRWYLHDGRMPAGIMVESGQADLLLISWLGVDALNQGERVYRLLGCEGTFHGELPKPGDTLCYDIHVDGYARQGPVLLFFFHYDCRIDGEIRLTVRNGHAGFFTPEELHESQGVLWTPDDMSIPADARLEAGAVTTTRARFTTEQVRAFSEGRVFECFGPDFERTETHTQSPRLPSGRMGLLGEVVELAPTGGPAGRGYLRCITRLSPDDWFFQGHFKNDPCMPGTLMFQACLQAMAFYLTAMGHTLARDGWRFEPVPDESYTLKCRGQAVPSSNELVYEVFAIELVAEPYPTLYADILCTVDGRKAFHGQRIGLRLVPDWPLESTREHVVAMSRYVEPRPVASVEGFEYGYPSLLACAWGRPSSAFGDMYRVFDGPRRVARLPGPPYHFMSRVSRIDAPRGGMQQGTTIESEYDVPPTAWYFDRNGARVMPFCVLVEIALQPCGWLASYTGCALTTDEDLYFRNLDGTATIGMEVQPDTGTLRVRTTLTSLSRAANTILVAFDVEVLAGDREVARLVTTFGFFTSAALANQSGLPALLAERGALEPATGIVVDLTTRPSRYFQGSLRLPDPMLLMIDRVIAYWPDGGKAGLGRARAEKTVDPSAWYFKAHFFQDPVQPGTLGVEGMLQLLQFLLLHLGLGDEIAGARFEPVALGHEVTWTYRGQVVPDNSVVTIDLELVRIERETNGVLAIADASLWVDGLPIYSARGLGMRIVGASAGMAVQPIDTAALRAHWRSALTIDRGSPSEDIYLALLDKYVRRVIVEDHVAFEDIRGRSALFLANHQVAIETSLFMILASHMTATEVHAVAKAEHRTSWLGDLLERTLGYPGMRRIQNVAYLDREDRASAAHTLEVLKRDLFDGHRSLLVHVEGTRSLSCRTPVERISAVFLDMAVDLDLPVVPVRFTGGLPAAPLAERIEFPLDHGSQDYYIGRPILPDVLRRAAYADRRQLVGDAINTLGPSPAREEPNPGDSAFATAVERWHETTGASREHAALLTALRQLPHPCAETADLLAGASSGSLVVASDERGRWLGGLARLLYGPHGPSVQERA